LRIKRQEKRKLRRKRPPRKKGKGVQKLRKVEKVRGNPSENQGDCRKKKWEETRPGRW